MIGLLLILAGCVPETSPRGLDLQPYPNPFTAGQEQWSPQPHRDEPQEVAVDGQGALWFSLPGIVDEPGHEIAVVDPESGEVQRVELGASSPIGLAMHPGGRWLVVLCRFSDRAAVIDTRAREVTGWLPTDPYAIEGVFTPDGRELWVTNRWHDTVEVWTIAASEAGLQRVDRMEPGIPVGVNPRDIAMSPDGRWAGVGTLTGLTVSVLDVRSRAETARLRLGAPANGLAFADDLLIVATTSASTHHSALVGPDGDEDGLPGDGTPNVNFQDLQNEIALIDAPAGRLLVRYTSDSICCSDYRDVDPLDLAQGGDLLPPREQWIVGGSLPEQVLTSHEPEGWVAWVTYSASNEVQRFRVDTGAGTLEPGPVWSTAGHNPHGMARTADGLAVVHRLSETAALYDPDVGTIHAVWEIGDLSAGPFPATDSEIGNLFNFVTARFTVDGDQSCTHCHREGGNLDKALNMPLFARPGMGSRMVMAYRGMADTRPWFFESAFDQTNFKPVMNEFARIENFCCSDLTLFPDGAPPDCAANPPPICATASNPGSPNGFSAWRVLEDPFMPARPTPYVTRDAFYLARAAEVIGRTTSFGDGVYLQDPVTGTRTPILLDFEGITRTLGLSLLTEPGLLPNPNPIDTEAERLGQALFEREDVGCAHCHPAPTYTASEGNNPFTVPLRMPPVVSPMRAETGENLDLLSRGFLDTFPSSEQDDCESLCGVDACAAAPATCDALRDVRLGAPTLRGIWDRAPRFLHDGRARSLREVLATPGGAGLLDGEQGFNERDGVIDTHGGTSHLSAAEIGYLVAFMETL